MPKTTIVKEHIRHNKQETQQVSGYERSPGPDEVHVKAFIRHPGNEMIKVPSHERGPGPEISHVKAHKRTSKKDKSE